MSRLPSSKQQLGVGVGCWSCVTRVSLLVPRRILIRTSVRWVLPITSICTDRHRIAPLSLCLCFLLSYAQSIVGVELSAINRKFINICQQKTFKLAKQQNYLWGLSKQGHGQPHQLCHKPKSSDGRFTASRNELMAVYELIKAWKNCVMK